MKIKFYQVDAFSEQSLSGNPAGICILEDKWLPNKMMQAIAKENNLPETAFIIKVANGYKLRWFTPAQEVNLCGHATLSSAYVVFQILEPNTTIIHFHTLSGILTVKRHPNFMEMDFPALTLKHVKTPELLQSALKIKPDFVYESTDYIVVVDSCETLKSINPNEELLRQLDLRGVAITAASEDEETDFVSRFFAPKLNIKEDPITGSAHCALVPYWAKRLRKNKFTAHQLTEQNIKLKCELKQDRVHLFGNACLYLDGHIFV